jgi:hypothetical protein
MDEPPRNCNCGCKGMEIVAIKVVFTTILEEKQYQI